MLSYANIHYFGRLKITPYERQSAPVATFLGAGTTIDLSTMSSMLAPAAPAPVLSTPQGNQLLSTKTAGPWGKKVEPAVAVAAPALPPAPVFSPGAHQSLLALKYMS